MSAVRWVVFDYGEVISRRTDALPELAARYGVPVDRFESAYWARRDAYDRGQPDLDYWRGVATELGLPAAEVVDETTAAELTERDVRGWLELDPGTTTLLDELTAAGVPLALLSNAPASFARAVERQPWARYFAHLVFSGDLGVAKPDAKIFTELVHRLDARPEECLFLDDRRPNVDGARAAGLQAELWSGADAARARLTELGLLP
ncbi:MAG TPA: HAD family phosphatase [Pseudonocardiaceae bacterium]